MTNFSLSELNDRISSTSGFVKELRDEMRKYIIGQHELIDKVIISLLSNGHLLLEGVPGLAKTFMVNTLSKLIDTDFQRIQFTPDMLPADLLGTLIYNQKTGGFDTRKGPIFSNIILADEINRSPAKVQSALLEAMQERQVTIGDNSFPLDEPFLVMATQNPIEQEGTYPLPEAQVDRFLFKLIVRYPDKNSERIIIRQNSKTQNLSKIKKIVSPSTILDSQNIIEEIYVDEKIEDFVLDLIFSTRYPSKFGMNDLENIIEHGASPRASINLIKAGKARAFTEHRGYVTPEDIRYVGSDVLRHRVILTYEAEAEELTADDVINRLFEVIEIP